MDLLYTAFQTFLIIAALIFFFLGTDLGAGILAFFGNRFLRVIRIQGDGTTQKSYAGRTVKVVSSSPDGIRVSLDGVTWNGAVTDASWVPNPGDSAKVVRVDGLVLHLEKTDEPAN